MQIIDDLYKFLMNPLVKGISRGCDCCFFIRNFSRISAASFMKKSRER